MKYNDKAVSSQYSHSWLLLLISWARLLLLARHPLKVSRSRHAVMSALLLGLWHADKSSVVSVCVGRTVDSAREEREIHMVVTG